jgi:hypothetical protein
MPNGYRLQQWWAKQHYQHFSQPAEGFVVQSLEGVPKDSPTGHPGEWVDIPIVEDV